MADDAPNPRIFQGANNPPEPSPFEGFDIHLTDLFEEAKNFLDGSGVNSDAEAEAVSKLLDMIRTAAKDADKARAAEKKPHDDAGKAVQAKWKPLLDRADMAVNTCKRVLAPWLTKKEAEARAVAEEARREAEARQAAAAEAVRQADLNDFAARDAAEALVKDAKKANADANRAEKARPQAAGGARATTLRSYFTAELTDARSALAHYVATNPEAIKACLQGLADTDVREGKRQIPGFTVHEEKRVV
jgi:hypothetical protein